MKRILFKGIYYSVTLAVMVLCVFALRYAHSGIDAPWYYWLLPYLLTAVYLVFAIWFIAGLKHGFYIIVTAWVIWYGENILTGE